MGDKFTDLGNQHKAELDALEKRQHEELDQLMAEDQAEKGHEPMGIDQVMGLLFGLSAIKAAIEVYEDDDGVDEDEAVECTDENPCSECHAEEAEVTVSEEPLLKVAKFENADVIVEMLRGQTKQDGGECGYVVIVNEQEGETDLLSRSEAMAKYQGYVSSSIMQMATDHVQAA